MHHHGADPGGHRYLLDARTVDADRQHQSAVERGRDVVDMQRAARNLFALHGELQQFELAEWLGHDGIRSHHRGDRGSGRTAEPGSQRDALVQFKFQAEIQCACCAQRLQRAARGILFRVRRQLLDDAADRADAHARHAGAPHGSAIAEGADRKAHDVEADGDIADGCRRERACRFPCGPGRTHMRAPRKVASRSRSANTPPAVTAGPAPGP